MNERMTEYCQQSQHESYCYYLPANENMWINKCILFKGWINQCRNHGHNHLNDWYHHNDYHQPNNQVQLSQLSPYFHRTFIRLLSCCLWILCCTITTTSGRHLSNAAVTVGNNSSERPMYHDVLEESNSIPIYTLLPSSSSSSSISLSLSSSSPSSLLSHEHNRALKRVFLSNRTAVCNDGTAAGFYLRKNASSKKWIVFLEGGWHCYDIRTCRTRWTRLRHLMTSSQWPETREMGGILSPLPGENPYWYNANHVLVPYCSSDSWSGTKSTPDSMTLNFRFMGSLILRQVISDLIPLGLGRIKRTELLLAGSSAGGLGVMLNLDKISNFLNNERKLQVTVRGVSDSGWFLDREPYTPSAVASIDAIRQGWSLWQGSLPQACVEQYQSEPWRCYFGYRLYPTLKAPLFVFQWLFDEAQMRADNVAAPVTPHQWNYIHAMGGALRLSLDKVDAVFAPSCIGHAVLSKREWLTIKIDDISLPTALRCWEHSTRPHRKRYKNDTMKRSTEIALTQSDKHSEVPMESGNSRFSESNERKQKEKRKVRGERKGHRKQNSLSDFERVERKRLRQEHRDRRQENRRHNPHRKRNNISNNLINSSDYISNNKTIRNQQRHKHKSKQMNNYSEKQNYKTKNYNRRQHLNVSNSSGNKRNGAHSVPQKCTLRLMERCSWPQCNHSCPTLTNPVTGEEMRFLELLASFGLDMEAVATALGVDMQTLNNMDRTELVNLLTQQVS